ncbi:hypothetical protein [Kineothrix sedimenti]|uniref:IrrE N-terminal-like domain-containing protein n=1 Tax=Kineothrix sedimenti TaxID=3123317 RepID=A0ABZ3EZV2_9FIRM
MGVNMNSFNDFYMNTYKEFYNACKDNSVLSSSPIPCVVDNTMRTGGKHENGTVFLKSDNISDKDAQQVTRSTIYHELTHYYDQKMFEKHGYSNKDINTLMLTFSEIHASYNALLVFLGYKNLVINRKIAITKTVYKDFSLMQFAAYNVATRTNNMNNIIGFKEFMYLLGEKRAFVKVSSDPLVINRAFSTKHLPQLIRDEIVSIDKLININSFENIDVDKISILRLGAENKLTQLSYKELLKDAPTDLQKEIQDLFGI